ncbi:MAG: UDP-galactopyranose mutase [Coriobacteriia bacterium]|nr:UDP-galactopyranose mutase [Coriobacteriia bacterium]
MNQAHYDYLVVGAGLTGAVFADAAKKAGKSVLVIEARDHIAGNVYTEPTEGIHVHKYGAHIFHTSLEPVWRYVNRFAEFNNYVNCPVALYKGTIYNMPFNMNTFSKMWGVVTPDEALAKINEQRAEITGEPQNLEEQAISLVGRDIFEALVKGYTEKQWGRDCKDLPASIIKRLPVRLTYDNNYFNDRWQGIPMGGYTKMVANMFGDTEVLLNTEYRSFIAEHPGIADRTIYCGTIDGFYDFELGTLEYRSLRFETERIASDNWQGNAVVNYNEREVPWTRIIEHKHFEFCLNDQGEPVKDAEGKPVTYITREYPADWHPGDEPYYPLNNERNSELYQRYVERSKQDGDIVFAGRLGGYQYYDMDKCIDAAFDLVKNELGIDLRA